MTEERNPPREGADNPTRKGEENFTQDMIIKATSKRLSLEEAVRQLKETAYVRTVRDTLARAAKIPASDGESLKNYLVEALLKTHPETSRNNALTKVSAWLSPNLRSVPKASAIEICFALNLSPDDAAPLLNCLCEEGFHWRDPEEIIFLYAMEHALSYSDALRLRDRMAEKGLLNADKEKDAPPPSRKKPSPDDLPLPYTERFIEEYAHVTNEAELEDFLREHQRELSELHNTAYNLFCNLLNLLRDPVPNDDADAGKRKKKEQNASEQREEKMSVQEIMELYFYRQCVPRSTRSAKGDPQKEKALSNALEKEIRMNWPDNTTISKMWNRSWDKKLGRRCDVTRKTLILLFLATDGGKSLYGPYRSEGLRSRNRLRRKPMSEEERLKEERENRQKEFREMYERMDLMLVECGFAPLDPRAPFDWMVLYCMCAEAIDQIDAEMEAFLTSLFQQDSLAEQSDTPAEQPDGPADPQT